MIVRGVFVICYKVVQELHTNFGLDPLFAPDEELNTVQEGMVENATELS